MSRSSHYTCSLCLAALCPIASCQRSPILVAAYLPPLFLCLFCSSPLTVSAPWPALSPLHHLAQHFTWLRGIDFPGTRDPRRPVPSFWPHQLTKVSSLDHHQLQRSLLRPRKKRLQQPSRQRAAIFLLSRRRRGSLQVCVLCALRFNFV